jgi:hypothetical protein
VIDPSTGGGRFCMCRRDFNRQAPLRLDLNLELLLGTNINNVATQYLDNMVFANGDIDIFHEISYAAIIRHNYVAHNGEKDPWILYGTNILVSTAKGVTIEHNMIEVHADYGNGIGIIWENRGPAYSSAGNRILDNTIRYHGTTGRSGAVAAADTPIGKRKIHQTNQFDRNTYYVTAPNEGKHYE